MKKLILILAMAAMAMASAGDGLCASRYTDGFRGVAWGTTKDKLPDLGLSKKTLKNIYKKGPSAIYLTEGRTNLDMNLDGIPLLSIFLRFDNMVFYGFDMVFKKEYADQVRAVVAKDLGSSGEETDDGTRWVQDGLDVTVTDRELMVTKQSP